MVCFQKERHFLPILFEDNDHRVTVDYKRYMNMLRKHFILVLRRRRVFDMDATMFQQGDAPPHCSKHTLEYLRQYFSGDRLNLKEDWQSVVLHAPLIWSCRTTLFGITEGESVSEQPKHNWQTERKHQEKIYGVPNDMLKRVVNDFITARLLDRTSTQLLNPQNAFG